MSIRSTSIPPVGLALSNDTIAAGIITQILSEKRHGFSPEQVRAHTIATIVRAQMVERDDRLIVHTYLDDLRATILRHMSKRPVETAR